MGSPWPAELAIIRHAQSLGNVAHDLALKERSQTIAVDDDDPGVPLTAAGIDQAEALGQWFKRRPPDVIWSSPYARACQTAEVARARAGLSAPIVLDERLRERELGSFNRLTGLGIRSRFPQEVELRDRVGKFAYRPPHGESWADVAERVRSFLRTFAQTTSQRTAIVTHQVVVLLLRYLIEELPIDRLMEIDRTTDLANCSLTIYRTKDGRPQLVSFNEVAHLRLDESPVTTREDRAEASP